jgi:hypothetical protein
MPKPALWRVLLLATILLGLAPLPTASQEAPLTLPGHAGRWITDAAGRVQVTPC